MNYSNIYVGVVNYPLKQRCWKLFPVEKGGADPPPSFPSEDQALSADLDLSFILAVNKGAPGYIRRQFK